MRNENYENVQKIHETCGITNQYTIYMKVKKYSKEHIMKRNDKKEWNYNPSSTSSCSVSRNLTILSDNLQRHSDQFRVKNNEQ